MSNKCALIVDDEPDIRELLEITLGRMGIDSHSAEDLGGARQLLNNHHFDVCLTDMHLPDGNGLELVAYIQDKYPLLPVAVITAYGSMETAVKALKAGAFDFVSKPVDLKSLRNLIDTAIRLSNEIEKKPVSASNLLGDSPAMVTLRKQIKKLARSQAPIYISGESGSGKELAAKSLHEQGPNASAAFIPVNCGAIPSELMESEFFGHKKGSFTGASSDKQGLFQAANGGTLFLDEVADLPLPMQVKLLRAIQEKAIRPVGGHEELQVDVRILSATHKNLAGEVESGRFRQDLFYRINVIELSIPALRERSDDIAELTHFLLQKISNAVNVPSPNINDQAKQALAGYSFPGNVRELENILERAFTLCDDDTITAADLQLPENTTHPTTTRSTPNINEPPPADDVDSLDDYLETIEKQAIVDALEQTRWNKTAAAKKLGITFRALRYKLKKLELE